MAKITRKTQKIFGGNSSNNAQFGSAREGTFVLDNDPDVLQALPAWEGGINQATVSGAKLPALEESQGVDYVVTRQIAYILQEGIPEYDVGTVYYQHSVVKESGTVKLYESVTDDNTGNSLSNPSFWTFLVDLSDVSSLPLNNYTATTDPTVNDDESDGYSTGSVWYNSTGTGEAFLCVDATIGAAKWIKTTLTVDELGSAAFQPSTAFATAAQGGLADTALQPGSIPFEKYYNSGEISIVSAGVGTLTHGMGVTPKSVVVSLVCKTDEHGYTAGTVIIINGSFLWSATTAANSGVQVMVSSDGASIGYVYGNTAQVFILANRNSGAASNFTNGNWRMVIEAFG